MNFNVVISSEAKQALDDHIHYIAVVNQEPPNGLKKHFKQLRRFACSPTDARLHLKAIPPSIQFGC